jgi:hypothetical protein
MNSGVVRWRPPVDADVIHRHTALGEQLLDIAVGEAVAQMPVPPPPRSPHAEPKASKRLGRARRSRWISLPVRTSGSMRLSPRPRSTRFADRLCPYSRGRVGACIRGGALALRHLGVLRSAGVMRSVDDGARWQTVRRSRKARTRRSHRGCSACFCFRWLPAWLPEDDTGRPPARENAQGRGGAPPGTEPRTRGLRGSGSVGAPRCWQGFAVGVSATDPEAPPALSRVELEDRGCPPAWVVESTWNSERSKGSLSAAKAQTPKVV